MSKSTQVTALVTMDNLKRSDVEGLLGTIGSDDAAAIRVAFEQAMPAVLAHAVTHSDAALANKFVNAALVYGRGGYAIQALRSVCGGMFDYSASGKARFKITGEAPTVQKALLKNVQDESLGEVTKLEQRIIGFLDREDSRAAEKTEAKEYDFKKDLASFLSRAQKKGGKSPKAIVKAAKKALDI